MINETPAIVECESLAKSYGKTKALTGLNLSLHAGQPIALVGPNGAGKTTLLSLVCGFIKPSQGRVSVMGETPGSAAALQKVSALPQDASLDPAFNISRQLRHYAQLRGLGHRQARHEAGRVLDLVQLTDRGRDKPAQLSHGMRKRVLMAQAMIGNPCLVILDEPTAGIDPPNVKTIRDIIAREAHKATFIISSHNLDELEKVCTSVIQLNQGKLQRFGTMDIQSNDGHITITLKPGNSVPAITQRLENTDGVLSARQTNPAELLIKYNSDTHSNLDITLLTILAENEWPYRRLIKGRSLEDQLFSTD